MSMCVYLCVCVHVCVHQYGYICACVHVHAYVFLEMYVCGVYTHGCLCVCVCPCDTRTLVLQGTDIFDNKTTTVNINPIGHNDWISLPLRHGDCVRCLLVADKFLNQNN